MDESIKCECGESKYWWFGSFFRCQKCYNEFKVTSTEDQDVYWVRRFNGEKSKYSESWEHLTMKDTP